MNAFVRRFPLIVVTAVSLLAVPAIHAQTTVSTGTCGYVQLTCTAASDTNIAVPFQQSPAFTGVTASVSGSNITLSGTTAWGTNTFVYSGSGSSTYYAIFGPATSGTNPKEGCWYQITANSSNTLTVALNGDNISSVPAGSYVSIVPFWTLGTVFPPSSSGTSFVASTSPLVKQTQILIPNYSGAGIDLSASAFYYFYNGAWRLVGDAVTNSHNDDILVPDGYFTVRNPNASTTLTAMGSVVTGNFTIPLASQTSGPQDTAVAVPRPVDTQLNSLGLITSGAFTPTTSTLQKKDLLLVFNNAAPGQDKSASAIYYYYNGGWRLVGDAITTDHGTDVIPAGSGFIVRKVATAGGSTAFWENPPSY